MTNEQIKELVKSHVYGMTTAEMSEIYGLSEAEIVGILTDNAAEIADEREYRDMLDGRGNVPKTAPTPRVPARVSAATVKTYTGADLSVHNGAVNMAGVKQSGHSFVILREGYGDVLSYPYQKDSRFESNYANAKNAGLSVGVYHYMYATTVNGARREAQGVINNLKGKSFDMPIALDIEERSQYNLSNQTVEAIVKAFMDVCEGAGYYCLLYSYESFLTAKMSAAFRSKYDVWCANISCQPSIAYGIHQYTFSGTVSGISGRVDLNRTAKDYPTIIKNAGKNGFKPDKPDPKALDTDGFRKGDKGLGVYFLKRWLMTKGYKLDDNDVYGVGTEKAVNGILGASGYAQNGVVGENFVKKFVK